MLNKSHQSVVCGSVVQATQNGSSFVAIFGLPHRTLSFLVHKHTTTEGSLMFVSLFILMDSSTKYKRGKERRRRVEGEEKERETKRTFNSPIHPSSADSELAFDCIIQF